MFYKYSEQPGARTLQGLDGIKEVYSDTLRTAKDIHLVRTRADVPSLGEEYFKNYKKNRAQNGIHTYSLTPFSPKGSSLCSRRNR